MRRKMDALGYLPLSLLATFHRVQRFTADVRVIAEAIRDSHVLEMTRDCVKVRTRHRPDDWPLPADSNSNADSRRQSAPVSPRAPNDTVSPPVPPLAKQPPADECVWGGSNRETAAEKLKRTAEEKRLERMRKPSVDSVPATTAPVRTEVKEDQMHAREAAADACQVGTDTAPLVLQAMTLHAE